MKKKISLCTLALTATLLTGCTQQNNQPKQISEDAAKQIVLEKVTGATAANIRRFKSDYENGNLQYEGTLYHEGKEYDFAINGYDGTIIEWSEEPIYD